MNLRHALLDEDTSGVTTLPGKWVALFGFNSATEGSDAKSNSDDNSVDKSTSPSAESDESSKGCLINEHRPNQCRWLV